MRKRKYIKVLATFAGAIIVIAGCIGCDGDKKDGSGMTATSQETEVTSESKRYNTEEVVVVTAIDTTSNTVTVKKPDQPGEFVLTYNGGTIITSKYGTQLMMEQFQVGEVAVARYVSGTQKLIELEEYGDAWENTMVVRWDVDYEMKRITIGSNTYSYDDNIFITSNGKTLDIREVSGIDELTVRGVGNKAYSVSVNKGHGYVRLTNTVNYVGGVIEIGDRLTAIIVEDMVLAAPEGSFELTATINGVGGKKEINVIRGQETVVSLGNFEQSVTRYGSVKLNVLPEDAQATLTIDGVEMDYSDLLSIAYGTHTLKLTSNNYDPVTKEITISSVYSTMNINMNGETETTIGTETETGTSSGSESTGGEDETTTTSGNSNPGSSNNLISITSPTGAKVYLDGAYKGTTPISFEKTPGEHTLIFQQDGYVTKSYTIDVSEDTEDMILSFPAMLEAE
ncbi:MAG: PEGA domain-containing protein [Lachnospiraceae bacterium]|nr:PEGA domain-containing protein [Lachnospiraceae bacterium]